MTSLSLDHLRYIQPPDTPKLSLHPSRMSPVRLAGVLLAAAVPSMACRIVRSRLCYWSGRTQCELFDSGRAALRWALAMSGARPGTEVVVSTFTCPAVVDAVLSTGARPVLVDTDSQSGPVLDGIELSGRIILLTNCLGLDEWQLCARRIVDRGGRIVLDLAQAFPTSAMLDRYRADNCPLVLSFGHGKALGGIGGGAALLSGEAAPLLDDAAAAVPMAQVGLAAICRAAGDWVIQRAPAPVRRRSIRRQRAASWWRESKADHMPQEAEPVTLSRPSRWQVGVTAAMLVGSCRRRAQAARVHYQVAATLAGTQLQLTSAAADLCMGLEFVLPRPYDRYQVASVLAGHGVPSTWNYYPLHLMQPYRHLARGPMQSAETIWTNVLTVPKQPQPRMRGRLLVTALREAAQALADAVAEAC